jgi:hypothetical protein
LPDQGAVSELPSFSIEGDDGLALVRYSKGDDTVTVVVGPGRDFSQHVDGVVGNFSGVVLDVAGSGEVLSEFTVGRKLSSPGRTVRHRPDAARAGVKANN